MCVMGWIQIQSITYVLGWFAENVSDSSSVPQSVVQHSDDTHQQSVARSLGAQLLWNTHTHRHYCSNDMKCLQSVSLLNRPLPSSSATASVSAVQLTPSAEHDLRKSWEASLCWGAEQQHSYWQRLTSTTSIPDQYKWTLHQCTVCSFCTDSLVNLCCEFEWICFREHRNPEPKTYMWYF